MLCQNCGKHDAATHVKRIINGEAAEIHLCTECAKNLGFAELLPDFISPFANGRLTGAASVRCETCGFTFRDISDTGRVGCPNCYRVFREKLKRSMQKLHGRAEYKGKIPCGAGEETVREHEMTLLKEQLNKAIDEQNFELAAKIRDELKKLARRGDEQNG